MIKQNLEKILSKLPSGVQLVAVSKFHPVERLLEAYQAGQRIFAESRPQELAAKVPQMPADVQWHFIGHLQTNKLKLVLPYVTLVQSVDSFHLLEAISAWAVANNRVVDVLLEMHLGAEETKQGFTEEEILAICGVDTPPEIASASLRPLPNHSALRAPALGPSLLRGRGWPRVVEDTPSPLTTTESHFGVRIRGLMGMATNTDDMAVVEKDFERIEALFRRIQAMGVPDFDILSIGMSNDWPVAVRHGATMVRIGTDIFGPREY